MFGRDLEGRVVVVPGFDWRNRGKPPEMSARIASSIFESASLEYKLLLEPVFSLRGKEVIIIFMRKFGWQLVFVSLNPLYLLIYC
jgi:hypothetical protein